MPEISQEEVDNWTPALWAPHKPTEKPVKTWTSRLRQSYVIACVTCSTPWPCEADGWRGVAEEREKDCE